ncbi:Uncharacterised protein [Escherichia coli]|uniref:Uncharacterized protein n=1 Tax=Escherichia coli TaxID=562 RepID=A0A376KMJ6_ECOLX|nr:Uncharacterised protein [Escherichia coli]
MKACRGGDLARWQGYEAGKNASLHHGVGGDAPPDGAGADDTGGVMNNSLSQATNGLFDATGDGPQEWLPASL